MDPDIIPLTEEDLHDLYLWVDEIPLSRPKRNIARDFSDGVCVAEVVKHYFPKLVELHNYQGANSVQLKIANWDTLNTRVFRKLFFEVPAEEIRDITAAVPGAVERFLRALRIKIEQIQIRQQEQQQKGGGGSSARGPSPSTAASYQPQQRAATGGRPSGSSPQHIATQQRPQQRSSSSLGNQQQNEIYELRDVLREKDRTIQQLQEAVALLTEKTSQLEDIINAKDTELRQTQRQSQGQRSSSANGWRR